jgi:nitroreductase
MNPTELLLSHRSIRQYSSKPIEQKLLNRLLEAGTRASTTGNMQVYSIIVTQDFERKEQLKNCHFNQAMISEAPVVLTFCADLNRFNEWCKLRNAEPGYDNFLWFINGAIDAILVAQNVCIAAEDAGLGICYLGTATYMADEIIDLLKLPHGVVPITAITLGYPAEIPDLTDRLPLKAVVHHEEYIPYSAEKINELYHEKENLELTKKLLEENRLPNLAQIFTEKRYKKTDNEFFSEKFIKTLIKQGFLENMSSRTK